MCAGGERIGFLVCTVAALTVKSVDSVHKPPVIIPPDDAPCLTVIDCAFLVVEIFESRSGACGGWVLRGDWIDNCDVGRNKMGVSESLCIGSVQDDPFNV